MKWLNIPCFWIVMLPWSTLHAQSDTTYVLQEVVVAYKSNRPAEEVPASLGIVGRSTLDRFSTASMLPAVNTIPGVRMEERSPGSYRFAIRGSSLRSPFGVRNVKFYWNGLPLTDGGGNTYLNLIDFHSVGAMEIIKGPGGSLYGAGTGGVVLLTSPRYDADHSFTFSATGGSYGLFQGQAGGTVLSTKKTVLDARTSYQRADGYRDQAAMERFSSGLEWSTALDNQSTLSGTLFNSNLNYETPGGLTRQQFEDNPRQARPPTPTIPGAEEQQAAVSNHTTYLGINYEQEWGTALSSRIGVFGAITDFSNPSIRNFEERLERNGGLRTDTRYHIGKSRWTASLTAGVELQYFGSTVKVFGNDLGTKASLNSRDQLRSSMSLVFAQADLALPYGFYFTAGASLNNLTYRDQPLASPQQRIRFDHELSPRVALLKKISPHFSLFANISRGFSPPTFAEALPSTGIFNADLNAERGTNYEMGAKGTLLRHLTLDITLYNFRMNDALVIRRDEDGAESFTNAGSTVQRGVEALIRWKPPLSGHPRLKAVELWGSVSVTDYFFDDYMQDGVDFSSNTLTGTAPGIWQGGFDIQTKNNYSLNMSFNYTERIALNDANTEFANSFLLVALRAGYRHINKTWLEFFAGVDNLLNERYSLGHDLNAIGNRFFNAAPDRNYYVGLQLKLPRH